MKTEKNWNNQLIEMIVGENKEFPVIEYDTILSTKSRLKRKGKGEWISNLSFQGLFVKRIR